VPTTCTCSRHITRWTGKKSRAMKANSESAGREPRPHSARIRPKAAGGRKTAGSRSNQASLQFFAFLRSVRRKKAFARAQTEFTP